MRNAVVASACVLGIAGMASIPYFIRKNSENLSNKQGELTGSQRQRGMYLNAGSRDAGPDPDWDPVARKWRGYERRNRKSQNDASNE